MATVFAYGAPDPTADYLWSIADARTGKSWSPSTNGFAVAPADSLMKMVRDTDPTRPAIRYGYLGFTLVVPGTDQYLAYVYPSTGVTAIDGPFALSN